LRVKSWFSNHASENSKAVGAGASTEGVGAAATADVGVVDCCSRRSKEEHEPTQGFHLHQDQLSASLHLFEAGDQQAKPQSPPEL